MKGIISQLQILATTLAVILIGLPSYAQQTLTVKGAVVDELGPVPGVNVMIPGTRIGTITNEDGTYSLANVPGNATLRFSSIGYNTIDVSVNGQATINVTMRQDSEQLEELVVIGYGVVKKSDLTGSVASVSEEDVTKSATSDPIQALQGRAAGVSIVSATGSPSATASIKIRGTGTPNDTNPLFVVDGFPMNDIDYLSPNDIESIEILKDASACAIYGSRGANGVVMITTKQAKAGAVKIKITAEAGVEMAPKKPEMLSSDLYTSMANLANKNSGLEPMYDKTTGLETTDWFSEVMRTGVYQNYNVNISGGSDKVSENFSVNYFNRQGTVRSTDFNRINLSSNTVFKPFKWLTLKASVSGSFSKYHALNTNGTNNNSIFLSSLIAPPNVPVWDDYTNYYSGISVFRLANPAGVIARNTDSGSNKRNNLIGNFSADIRFLKDFVFTSRFGYRFNFSYSDGFSPIYYETSNIASGNNSVSRSTSYAKDWTWENMLSYNKKIGKAHYLSVVAAVSARDFYTENYSASRMDIPTEKSELHYLSSATNVTPSVEGTGSALGMLSYLGRINYTLLDRYLITASFRADGSSRFVGKNKWGYFPSAAIAWKLSEEPFFKNWNQNVIDNVKIRAGWGQIGNERLRSFYPYQTNISQGQYYILGDTPTRINGAAPTSLGNKELQWETSEQTNIGLDIALLKDRFSFTMDYFIRKTDDILLSESVPRTSGTASITRNVGGMKNSGFEFTIGWKDDVRDFRYDINANLSLIKNEVTNLGKAGYLASSFAYDYALIDFQGQFSNLLRSEPGHPFNQFYGYKFLGIFQNQAEIDNYKNSQGQTIMPNAKPGDSIFEDRNDDGKINSSDMTFIGDPNPKVTYGININLGWKNFDLSMLWQGVQGVDIFNASKFYFEKFDGRQNVYASSYQKGWSGEGSTNSTPITLAYSKDDTRNNQNWWQSTMYVEDGSYFRLKNIQLGYTLNRKIGGTSRSFRFYFSAQNLLTITKYSGLDPEISDGGVDRGQYPQPRTFLFGVNVNL